jgi:hypothetical protein
MIITHVSMTDFFQLESNLFVYPVRVFLYLTVSLSLSLSLSLSFSLSLSLSLTDRNKHRLRVKGWKKTYQANGPRKQAGVALLISDKVYFKPTLTK